MLLKLYLHAFMKKFHVHKTYNMNLSKLAIAALFFTGITIACNKSDNISAVTTSSQSNAITASACNKFAYPDTIFYPRNTSDKDDEYIVMPLVVQEGKYGSFPDGLQLDGNSGAIRVNKSETGLKYIVWFVKDGTRDTCKKFVTISGINYRDSIFTVAGSRSTASIPVYNANAQAPIACTGGCEFGKDLAAQGVVINQSTGTIDLKKTIQNGALGANPKNGTFKDFVVNYRISDKSQKTLNSITVRLIYYKLRSQIPDSLINIINLKQSQVLEEDDDNPDHRDLRSSPIGSTAGLSVNLTSKGGQGEVKCRPPYIIVTPR